MIIQPAFEFLHKIGVPALQQVRQEVLFVLEKPPHIARLGADAARTCLDVTVCDPLARPLSKRTPNAGTQHSVC